MNEFKEIFVLFVFSFFLATCTLGQLSTLKPGEFAPSFRLQTLNGRISYKKAHKNTTTPQHPIIFHAFTNRSAFLEVLWTNKHSIIGLLLNSPRNTRYVFMSFSENAKEEAQWMRRVIYHAVDNFYRYNI
jgi:hypothetical protein